MVKKTLMSLAIAAATVGLTACDISSIDGNDDVSQRPVDTGLPAADGGTAGSVAAPIFAPTATDAVGIPKMPLTTDLLFQGLAGPDTDGADGTIPFPAGDAPITSDDYNPIFSALADLDGFSPSAPIDIQFSGAIDGSSLNSTMGAATQNVFLVPLLYCNDPLSGGVNRFTTDQEKAANGCTMDLTAASPATLSTNVFDFASLATTATQVTALGYATGGTDESPKNVLRIFPTVPLKSATRYLVAITDGINAANGSSVRQAPWFTNVINGNAPTTGAGKALADGIQGWIDLATGFFLSAPAVEIPALNIPAGTFANPAVAALRANNVVYATTFTTGGTTQVLTAMAAPAGALGVPQLAQTLPANLRYVVEQSFVDGDDDAAAAGDLVAAAGGPGNLSQADAGAAVLLARNLPQPAPREATFTNTGVNLNAIINTIPAGIELSNGSIKLPYYLSAPSTNPALLPSTAGRTFVNFWQADDTLGSDFSALLGALNLTAADVAPPSTNVTRLFPLAKTGVHTDATNPMGYVDVPISVVYSSALCPGGDYNPIIYQHGITSDRTAAFPFAAQMIAGPGGDPCAAIVAIDLPMHGWVAGESATSAALLASLYAAAVDLNGDNVVNQVDNVILGTLAQRHFGLTQGTDGRPRSIFVTAEEAATLDVGGDLNGDGQPDGTAGDGQFDLAGSGSLFINIANFQNSRDNIRQAVMDLMNLNASLAFLDFDGNAGADFSVNVATGALTDPVRLAGHSLGSIIATTFLSVNNSVASPAGSAYLNQIQAAALSNGGSQFTKLLENSAFFSPTLLGGFAALGEAADLNLTQGTQLLETTFAVFQGILASTDPVNFASAVSGQNAGILAFEIVGDAEADPARLPDQVVPVNTNPPLVVLKETATATSNIALSSSSPLAGSQPMHALMGLNQTSADVDGNVPLRAVVRFTAGEHSSFGRPSDPDIGINAVMMSQVRSFFASGGQDVTITNDQFVLGAP